MSLPSIICLLCLVMKKATNSQNGCFRGRFEFPNALRHHPRFREFWELPGMPELAAVRRANGVTARLPLPVKADE